MPPTLRLAVFGTPAFAVPTLEALAASPHRVVLVVTQPDRPQGRGQRVQAGAMAAAAARLRLPLLQPERLAEDTLRTQLPTPAPDLAVVAAYGRLLPAWLLAWPRLGMINVHASLLPRYRGAAPIHRAVLAGDTETGVTIMQVVQALDAGPMLARASSAIAPDQTSVELEATLAQQGATLARSVVDAMAVGAMHAEPQDDAQATYARKISRDDSPVRWSSAAVDIHNQIRGLHPWPHAATHVDGRRLLLHRSHVGDRLQRPAGPGTVVASGPSGIEVACGDGRALVITHLQAEGGRVLQARDFLAGRPLAAGLVLGDA